MITLNQHRQAFTQRLMARFVDAPVVRSGFEAFFPKETTSAKAVSIEVQRNKGLVAVDVQRCSDPVRNTFSRSTEKIFIPPYFNESFDFTACQRYDETFGSGGMMPTKVNLRTLMNDSMDELDSLRNKILRAIELQRSQVLQTGIVLLKNGDSIDFKRKAASMKDLTVSGTPWTTHATANPAGDLETGLAFLRGEGNSSQSTVNAVMGGTAFTNFMANEKVIAEGNYRRIERVNLAMPQFDNLTGLAYQGQYATGDFIVNLWTYNETYIDPADNVTVKRYLDANTVILIPSDFIGKTWFAGVPAILGDSASGQYVAQIEAEFYVRDIIDQIRSTWEFMISSAPLAAPVSVDRIYTLKTA